MCMPSYIMFYIPIWYVLLAPLQAPTLVPAVAAVSADLKNVLALLLLILNLIRLSEHLFNCCILYNKPGET